MSQQIETGVCGGAVMNIVLNQLGAEASLLAMRGKDRARTVEQSLLE